MSSARAEELRITTGERITTRFPPLLSPLVITDTLQMSEMDRFVSSPSSRALFKDDAAGFG
jgi:hypothetical protein